MRRIIAILLVTLLLACCSTAHAYDLSGYTDAELAQLASEIAAEQQARKSKTGDYIISGYINGCFVGLKKTYVKNNVLYLVLDFSHTYDEPESFGYNISLDGYQDGIECNGICGGKENNVTNIKKGVKLEVTETMELINDSPVEIEIGKWLDFSGKGEKLYTVVPGK